MEVPRHWRSPGEDGYRTPTIEDAERAVSIGSAEYPFSMNAREAHTSALGAINDTGSTFRPVTSNSEKRSVSDNIPGVDHAIPPRVPSERSGKLSWRQRIRHFTWAYFTLTMATGGIANVLYAGKTSRSSTTETKALRIQKFLSASAVWKPSGW